jgi:uncharacterized protein
LPSQSLFDPGGECRLIARRFGDAMGTGRDACRGADPGIVPGNLIVLLPYALAEALELTDGLEAARTMALGNAFGTAHFLQQDRWLDGDECPAPEAARLADISFLLFANEYARLFASDSTFWGHLERYLGEFFESLEWEARVLFSDGGAASVADGQLSDTLTKLGRKMSPLKACAAGTALLAGQPDTLALAERMVDCYHAAYQLTDDVDDLEEDLAAGRWSTVAWLLASRAGLDSPGEAASAGELLQLGAGAGAFDEIVELVCSRYDRAAAEAALLGGGLLESYFRGLLDRARRVLGRAARRLAVVARGDGDGAGGGASRDHRGQGGLAAGARAFSHCDSAIHGFSVDGQEFVYDRRSGLFFEADRLAADAVRWLRSGAKQSELDVLRMNHGMGPVGEALGELSVLAAGPLAPSGLVEGPTGRGHSLEFALDERPLPGGGPSLTGIASVALNVSGACNLACDYCYLGREPGTSRLMSEEVARKAVDLLFRESFGERSLSVIFFGGEPLLNPGVIEFAAGYAQRLARSRDVEVSFHMTTNGTLLTSDAVAMLHECGVRILVSVDGHADYHDAHRPFPDGRGSYEAIAANLRALPEGTRPGARATVTEDSSALTDLVEHLTGLGFGVVHLSPVSGGTMNDAFAERLAREYEDLARSELAAIRSGRSPAAGCFIEPVLSLEMGRQRLSPCGAGARYVSVDHDGRLFLCHRFAGDEERSIGDVDAGLDRRAVGALLHSFAERSSACRDCWAYGLCGGPCMHDVDCAGAEFSGPHSARCRVTRRVLELSMWLYASLPDESRQRLSRAARTLTRPELTTSDAGPGRQQGFSSVGVPGRKGATVEEGR